MKKLFSWLTVAIVVLAVGCSESFDDSGIWNKLNEHSESIKDHEQRISALEELCKQMNTNISALQTLVEALQKNDYITSITPITKDGVEVGYTIAFAKSNPVTIYHGTNGKDGVDGADGKDGKDGYMPQIGVKQDVDGIYYWIVDGKWLLDENGNKIKAVGEDGEDGQDGVPGKDGEDGKDGQNGEDGKDGVDGKDGITPRLKIEEGYWYISYDEGTTWTELGKATGEDGTDGTDGQDGDNIFTSVTQDDEYVYFHLADGTMLKLPKFVENNFIIFTDKDVKKVCIGLWDIDGDGELSYDEASQVNSIGTAFKDNVDIEYFNEFQYFNTIKSLDAKAFGNCTNLKTITIPSSISEIDATVFEECTSLYRVIFDDTSNLKVIQGGYAENDDTYYGLFANCKSLKYVFIPSSVTEIQPCAFYGCENLTTVEFGKNSKLTKIAGGYSLKKGNSYKYSTFGAFQNCKSLVSITIPVSVEEIGQSAFSGCVGLKTIIFEKGCKLKKLSGGFKSMYYGTSTSNQIYAQLGCFKNCSSLLSVEIPASVEIIESGVFLGCSSLANVSFEEGAKLMEFGDGNRGSTFYEVASGVFENCTSLNTIVIPESVEKIGTSTFKGCTKLESIVFEGESLLKVINGAQGSTNYNSSSEYDYGAFTGCSNLKEIYLPENLAEIGEVAFSRCIGLMDVYCKATTPPGIKTNTFNSVPSSIRFYVPAISVEIYKTASVWKNYSSSIVSYNFE